MTDDRQDKPAIWVVGNSGCGKSTLINKLVGKEIALFDVGDALRQLAATVGEWIDGKHCQEF